MKHIAVRITFALALLLSVSTLRGQAADVTGGSFSLTMDPTFTTLLQGQGVAMSVFCRDKAGTQFPFIAATTGTFDLASGLGTVSGVGQMLFQTSAGVLRIYQLSFENLGPYPMITGAYYLNGHFMGRNSVFWISSLASLKTPFAIGNLLVSGIPMTVSPYLALVLNNTFHVAVPSATHGGNLGLNLGLVADETD